MSLSDTHYTPDEVADILGKTKGALVRWRTKDTHLGPPWVKIGGSVWYKKDDIENYINGKPIKEKE